MQLQIREIRVEDTERIREIDAVNSGIAKDNYWEKRLKNFNTGEKEKASQNLGFVAQVEGEIIAYILSEVRAWEFGSPPCGWIFAVGIDPVYRRRGVASALCSHVCRQFKSLDVKHVRTMVRRDNLDLLSFFRASGFRAGPFVELELNLES